jgi:Glutathione peroxidase
MLRSSTRRCRLQTPSANRLAGSPLGGLRYGTAMSTLKDFSMKSITGEQVSFDQFEGKVALIINVASA